MKAWPVKWVLPLISWVTIHLSSIELSYLLVDVSGQLLRVDQPTLLEIVFLTPTWCARIRSSECAGKIQKENGGLRGGEGD